MIECLVFCAWGLEPDHVAKPLARREHNLEHGASLPDRVEWRHARA